MIVLILLDQIIQDNGKKHLFFMFIIKIQYKILFI